MTSNNPPKSPSSPNLPLSDTILLQSSKDKQTSSKLKKQAIESNHNYNYAKDYTPTKQKPSDDDDDEHVVTENDIDRSGGGGEDDGTAGENEGGGIEENTAATNPVKMKSIGGRSIDNVDESDVSPAALSAAALLNDSDDDINNNGQLKPESIVEAPNTSDSADDVSSLHGVNLVDEELGDSTKQDPPTIDKAVAATPSSPDPSPTDQSPSSQEEDNETSQFQTSRRHCRYLTLFTILFLTISIIAISLGITIDHTSSNINKSTIYIELPTFSPTNTPSWSIRPTGSPSDVPTVSPSLSTMPSGNPSVSMLPSWTPSVAPSLSTVPSLSPSGEPTAEPSITPSEYPSQSPSAFPTATPSLSPSESPTQSPSGFPSVSPTDHPSSSPSESPTISSQPSSSPTTSPSISTQPSSAPSMEIEPLRTLLSAASPRSKSSLFREQTNQYRALYWLYYDTINYDSYSDEEKIQLWSLGVFYYDTLGHQWYNNSNWLSDTNVTVCDWYGIQCGTSNDNNNGNTDGEGISTEGKVISIDLATNRVRRDIPYEITLLTSLQYLGLSYNSLGKLEEWLFSMPSLEVIDLDGNGIQYIPNNIPKKNRVKELYLAENEIWEIPSSIGRLRNLEVLWLWNNDLEGTLPDYLSGLRNLAELDVEDNYLSGDLWPIAQLPNIQSFYAFDNMLGGEETTSPYSNVTTADGSLEKSPILQVSSLNKLDISTNYYFGTIPASIGSGSMNKLTELYLENLELDGSITPELFSLSKLEKLYIGINYLEGTLPIEISNAKNLQFFRAQNNYRERESNGRLISKGVIGSIPTTIAKLSRLEDLRLENNYISGTLPSEMGNLEYLARVQLELNLIRGQLPTSLESLTYLKTFTASGNYMDGPLPNELRSSLNMTTLHLHDNAFTGTIPTQWGSMADLTSLDLSYNELTGEVPTEYGNLIKLEKLYLEWNKLYGFMPEEVCLLKEDDDIGSLDKLVANCDTPRKNTARPTRRPVVSSGEEVRRVLQDTVVVAPLPTTASPTEPPSESPTERPTESPSFSPTMVPTTSPTVEYFWVCKCCSYCELDPEIHPTLKPTKRPTPSPTISVAPSPTRGVEEDDDGPSGNWWGNN